VQFAYTVSGSAKISIDIYRLTGERVAHIEERKDGGSGSGQTFTTAWEAAGVAPGVYFCRIQASSGSRSFRFAIADNRDPAGSAGKIGSTGEVSARQMANVGDNTIVASATITNVTLGSHLFQVQAQDTNGMWGPATNFQFTVWAPGTEPPAAPPGLVCNVTANGVPTYTTNTERDHHHILENSGARAIIAPKQASRQRARFSQVSWASSPVRRVATWWSTSAQSGRSGK